MSGRTVTAWLVGLSAVAALLAPGAWAGKPTFEVIEVDASFPDAFLSDECGVAVTTHAEGKIVRRTTDAQSGLGGVSTVNIALTATAGDNTFRFRDVGADLLRIEPDGTAVVMIIGRLPFDFTGVLKFDPDTGDAILEPHHFTDTERACAALTA